MTVILAHLLYTASALPSSASDLRGAISSLEKAIAPLEDSSGHWEKSLPWFTGLVVVGLIAEIFALVWERRDGKAAWLHWVAVGINPGERPSNGKFALEVFASIAIFLGVAGELGAGAEIAYLNGQLRNKNSDLRTKSDQLVALISEQSSANAREAAQLRKDAAAIEESVKWRRLSADQQAMLTGKLRQFAQPAIIQFNTGDTESNVFAITIASALSAAHWKVNQPSGGMFLSISGAPVEKIKLNVLTGVRVGSPGNSASSKALVKQLNKLGFDAVEDHNLDAVASGHSKLWVVVFPRPEGPQGEAKLRLEAAKGDQQSTQITK